MKKCVLSTFKTTIFFAVIFTTYISFKLIKLIFRQQIIMQVRKRNGKVLMLMCPTVTCSPKALGQLYQSKTRLKITF